VNVDDHVIAVGKDLFDLAVIVGILLFQEIDEPLETFRTILGSGIVLRVAGPEIFRCLVEVLFIEHRVIEDHHGLFVLLHLRSVGGERALSRKPDNEQGTDGE
jgi:hypothetical protein